MKVARFKAPLGGLSADWGGSEAVRRAKMVLNRELGLRGPEMRCFP